MFSWLRRSSARDWRTKSLLALDMELSGLEPAEDAILSAGSVFIRGGRIDLASAEHHFFTPPSLMGADVSRSAHIHLITDRQLETQGESLADWLLRLTTELHADAWVFHHAALDCAFLQTFCTRYQLGLQMPEIIDTVQREKKQRANEHLESHAQLSLNTCRARYGLPIYRQHHALSDALATAELFIAQQSQSRVNSDTPLL